MIAIDNFIALTRDHSMLAGFVPRDLQRLADLAQEVHFPLNRVIFREGEKHGVFYLILNGSIELEMTATGQPVYVQTLHGGDAMGWSSLVDPKGGAHFEARVLAPVRALAFDGAALREACESDPAFGYRMMKALLALVTDRLDASRMQLVDMYAAEPGAFRK